MCVCVCVGIFSKIEDIPAIESFKKIVQSFCNEYFRKIASYTGTYSTMIIYSDAFFPTNNDKGIYLSLALYAYH